MAGNAGGGTAGPSQAIRAVHPGGLAF